MGRFECKNEKKEAEEEGEKEQHSSPPLPGDLRLAQIYTLNDRSILKGPGKLQVYHPCTDVHKHMKMYHTSK